MKSPSATFKFNKVRVKEQVPAAQAYESTEPKALWEALKQPKPVPFRAFGDSMQPVYPPNTVFLLEGYRKQALRVGDLVLVEGEKKTCLHRIIQIRTKPSLQVVTKGDACPYPDGAFTETQLRAVAIDVLKNNTFVSLKSNSQKRQATVAAQISKWRGFFNRCLRKVGIH